jgi:penicillin-binding protein 2
MSPQLARRVALLGAFALVLFAALFFRLWFLQILSGDDYVSQAAQNKVRKIRIEAPRGNIVDRNGRVLVKTRQAAVVQILPSKLPEAERDVAVRYGSLTSAAERERLTAEAKLKTLDRNLRREGRKKSRLTREQRRRRRELQRAASKARPVALPPIPADPTVQRLFRQLGRVIDESPREIHRSVIEQVAQTPYAAVTVKTDIGRAAFNYLEERQDEFPGVEPEIQYIRSYPFEEIGAHLFGTLREISPDELKEKKYKGVAEGERIGKDGVEETYDRYLRGRDGYFRQVVDAFGEPCDDPITCPVREVKPQQGQQLELTLDLGLQKAATEAVERGVAAAAGNGAQAGAFVAMDPRNGEILALGSVPSFDANLFAKPISQEHYDELNSEAAAYPLLNRAISAVYPTGSTFKLITAAAALESGQISGSDVIQDGGSVTYGTTRFQNAGGVVNGTINIVQALTVSSDVFFYTLGANMNDQPGEILQSWARNLGLGKPTGIDLPGEFGGLVPDAEWRNTAYAEYQKCTKRAGIAEGTTEALYACGGIERPWSLGDNVNLAVGQGDLQATPLQMAVAYATMANGGTVVRPHLGKEIQDGQGRVQQRLKTPPRRTVDISDTTRNLIMDGLHLAASAPNGTSSDVFKGFPYPVYGKTGTAERGLNPDQSWYVAYVPDAARPIVVAVTIERGGFGAETAAPAARLILSDWFDLGDASFRAGDSATR